MKKRMNIYVVIVTYANRFELLEKTIKNVIKEGVYKIIIVDNNSVLESKQKIKSLEEKNKKIKVIYLNQNKGSSGGFKSGLIYAKSQHDCDFIYLLDDDNILEEGALNKLVSFWENYKMINKESGLVLNSLRYYDAGFLKKTEKELELENVEKDVLILNSFCYFSVDKVFSLFRNKFVKRENNNKEYYEMVCGAYGGLFFHKYVLKYGFPDEYFFVYFDDIEFTYRLHNEGVKIYLIPTSKITDIDRTLVNSEVKSYFSFFKILENIKGMGEVKLYYGYRNRVFLERKCLVKNKFKYFVNRFIFNYVIYPCTFFIYFICYGEVKNMLLMKNAIKGGLL